MPSKRCDYDGCRERTHLLGFSCKCCEKVYCAKHRLFEDHGCETKIREEAFQANKLILLTNAMVDTHHHIKI